MSSSSSDSTQTAECKKAVKKVEKKLDEFEKAYDAMKEKCSTAAAQRELREQAARRRQVDPVNDASEGVPPPPGTDLVFDDEGPVVPANIGFDDEGSVVSSLVRPVDVAPGRGVEETKEEPAPSVASSVSSEVWSVPPVPRILPSPEPSVVSSVSSDVREVPQRPRILPRPVKGPVPPPVETVEDSDLSSVASSISAPDVGMASVASNPSRATRGDINPAPPKRLRPSPPGEENVFEKYPFPDPQDPDAADWWAKLCSYCDLMKAARTPRVDVAVGTGGSVGSISTKSSYRERVAAAEAAAEAAAVASLASSSLSSNYPYAPYPPYPTMAPRSAYEQMLPDVALLRAREAARARQALIDGKRDWFDQRYPPNSDVSYSGSLYERGATVWDPAWDNKSDSGYNYNTNYQAPPRVPPCPCPNPTEEELNRLRNLNHFEEDSVVFESPEPLFTPSVASSDSPDVAMGSVVSRVSRTDINPRARKFQRNDDEEEDVSMDSSYAGGAVTRSKKPPLVVKLRSQGAADEMSLGSDYSEDSRKVRYNGRGSHVDMETDIPDHDSLGANYLRFARSDTSIAHQSLAPARPAFPYPYVELPGRVTNEGYITEEDVYQGLSNLLVWACKPMKAFRVSNEGFEGGEPKRSPNVDIGKNNIWNPTGTLAVGGLYLLRFSGYSETDPGKAGAGAVIYDGKGEEYWFGFKKLGDAVTVNIAHYCSMVYGLKAAASLGVRNLVIETTSNLVHKQMNGDWEVKTDYLKKFFSCIQKWVAKFDYVEVRYIKATTNGRAIWLAENANELS